MPSFQISRHIAAPAEDIWAILTDAEQLASGDFGILQLTGQIAPGARIKLVSEVDPKRSFALRVTEFDRPRRMVWTGGMPLGLFTGRRRFTLTPEATGTRFEMTEVFSGPLAGLIGKSLPDLTPSFEQFATALQNRAAA